MLSERPGNYGIKGEIMKRTNILIGLLISVILCGCASGGQNVQLSREDNEKPLEMAEGATESASSITDKSTPTPTPTPTEPPQGSPDSEKIEYMDVHFDVLNIDLKKVWFTFGSLDCRQR